MNDRVYWKSNQQHVSEATLTKTKQRKMEAFNRCVKLNMTFFIPLLRKVCNDHF